MYSLFIGLSLGGVPTVWRLARRAGNGDTANRLSPEEPGAVAGPARSGGITLGVSAAGGFGVMFLLALLQWNGVVGSGGSSVSMSIFAGLAGASAMILPGISGAYLLLILGQYVPILGAIDEFKSAIQAGQWQVAWLPAKSTLIPVGIGVVLGIAIVGNLIQYMLRHHLRATAGFLLGLLLGSVITLWPFQEGVQPQPGQIIKGQVIQADAIESIEPEDWPTQYYRPAFLSVVAALGLIAVGFGATCGIARIGLGTNNSTL
jgi:putative membrane protein